MAKRKGPGKQKAIEISDDEEWIALRFPMPAYVTGEGEPYRPEVSMWLSSDGGIVASELSRPGDPAAAIGATLRQALAEPLFGPPRRPARIRVAEAALVPAIQALVGDVEVQVAPTPEADLMRSLMAEMPGGGDPIPYRKDVPPELLAGFHGAAARLYRLAPWKMLEDDLLFGVRAPSLGLQDGCLVFIGHLGESFGALLFDSLEAYRRFRSACEAAQDDIDDDEAPPPDMDLGARVFSINFERGADLPPALKRLIKERGLEVGGPRGYPVLGLLDPDRTPRPVGAADVTLGWACAAALTRFLQAHGPALNHVRAPVRERYTLDEIPGAPELELRAPRPGGRPADGDGEEADGAVDDLISAFRASRRGGLS